MAGIRDPTKDRAVRGEYYKLRKERQNLVGDLIYALFIRSETPNVPSLAVHIAGLIGGGVEARSNVVLALAREGYRNTDLFPARLYRDRHLSRVFGDSSSVIRRSAGKTQSVLWQGSLLPLVVGLQRLIPYLLIGDLSQGGAVSEHKL
jgi:L-2-hydroxyglutarate oxidase